ncbi:MAG: hypothetical protein Q7Q71_14945 [Verrucomicrobiota bacterium JB023]|nr:hypothetical protein [Verrucomicrobiota bacterium JB023]
MSRLITALFLAFCLAQGAFSQEFTTDPVVAPPSPSKELAVRLISESEDRLSKDYTVALILPGRADLGGIELENAAKVVYFGPMIVDG